MQAHYTPAVSPDRSSQIKFFNWDKVFKNGPSRICERQPLKIFKGYGLLSQME